VLFELSRCCFQVSRSFNPLLRMWQRALDEQFTLPAAISQIISQCTPTSPNSICDRYTNCTGSVRLMKCVLLVFKDPYRLIGTMIVTLQKWLMTFNLLIQHHSVPCICSTVAGGLCIITIMISCIGTQTSVNNDFYHIYYYYDILTKPRIK